jgi:hypothetical protein
MKKSPGVDGQARHDDLGPDRVGDEAFLVRAMMKLGDFVRRRPPFARKPYTRVERHLGDEKLAALVLGHHAQRVVLVDVDHEARLGGKPQEEQHVAARQRGDERLFRIDRVGAGVRQRHARRRRGGRHLDPAVEAPDVPAVVFVVGERRAVLARPPHRRLVFVRHAAPLQLIELT